MWELLQVKSSSAHLYAVPDMVVPIKLQITNWLY